MVVGSQWSGRRCQGRAQVRVPKLSANGRWTRVPRFEEEVAVCRRAEAHSGVGAAKRRIRCSAFKGQNHEDRADCWMEEK